MASSASACLSLSQPPAPCLGAPAGILAVGDYEVRLSGPSAGLWRKGARLGAPLLCWPCSAVVDGVEGGGWILRHPRSASLLCIEARDLMAFGPSWLASRLLANKYAFEAPVRPRAVAGYLWQCWLQRLAATQHGVLPAGSPEACRTLKAPVWKQEA